MIKTIQGTLFEMSVRLIITLCVMIVFGERSSSKILYIFYGVLIIWSLVIPIKNIVTSQTVHLGNKENKK